MKRNSGLTIAIVTKKRPLQLRRCLNSICKQTVPPKFVMVVDNDTKFSGRPIVADFFNKLNIEYISEKASGVAVARNTALRHCRTNLLGFIDDDCILSQRWVEVGVMELMKDKNFSYVVGNSLLYNSNNLLAAAQHYRDLYWRKMKLKQTNETMEYHVDTKNIIIDLGKITRYKLIFDTHCSIGDYDSADLDFGLQLVSKSLRGIYSSKMVLWHEETPRFTRYLSRAYFRGKIAGYLNAKWKLGHRLVNLYEASFSKWGKECVKHFARDQKRYTRQKKLSILKKFMITIFIKFYERFYLLGYLDYLRTHSRL